LQPRTIRRSALKGEQTWVWTTLRRVLRQVLDSPANDFELSNHCVLLHSIAHEGVSAASCVLLDVVDGVADMREIDAVVLHSGRDSDRIRPRSAGCTLTSVRTSTFRWSRSSRSCPERDEIQQGAPGVHIDQQVNVAAGMVLATSHRSEYAKVVSAVHRCDSEDLVPLALQIHSAWGPF
jgi:hypothetical protein